MVNPIRRLNYNQALTALLNFVELGLPVVIDGLHFFFFFHLEYLFSTCIIVQWKHEKT